MFGVNRALATLTINVPHDGYRDGEVPQYRDCVNCHVPIRVDRTDLIAEHNHVCAHPLTPREHLVLNLIAEGLTNEDIGRALSLAAQTIKRDIIRILAKFDTPSRAGAVAIAFRQGLLR